MVVIWLGLPTPLWSQSMMASKLPGTCINTFRWGPSGCGLVGVVLVGGISYIPA